jgi:hypothetical protein
MTSSDLICYLIEKLLEEKEKNSNNKDNKD